MLGETPSALIEISAVAAMTRLGVHDTFGFSRSAPGVGDPGNVQRLWVRIRRCRAAFEQITQMPTVFGTGKRQHLQRRPNTLAKLRARLIKSLGVDDQCFRLRISRRYGIAARVNPVDATGCTECRRANTPPSPQTHPDDCSPTARGRRRVASRGQLRDRQYG